MQLHQWKADGSAGDSILHRYLPPNMSALDYFMWMFSSSNPEVVTAKRNMIVERKGLFRKFDGEILQFFAVLIVMNSLGSLNRRDLWISKPISRFIDPVRIRNAMS